MAESSRYRRLGVRWQATVVAVATVGLALLLSAIALVVLTQRRLESAIEGTITARADTIVALVEANAVTDSLPGRDPELLGQIVDDRGVVLAADRAAAELPPIASTEVAPGRRQVLHVPRLAPGIEPEVDIEDSGPFLLVAEGVTIAGRPATVLVAASLEDALAARSAFVPLLGLGLPALLIIVGLVTWVLTGRALHPVDEMRREAERISALALDRRLPLPDARDELHRLAATLNDMLERLEGSSARQRRFVGDASHELKSPLTTLRTIVDVAAANPPDVDIDALTTDLGEEIDRMEHLVADLLALARYDEGAQATAEPMDLAAIGAEAAALAVLPVNVEIDTAGLGPVLVLAERGAVVRAVRNLVENAARHTATRVWLESGRWDGVGALWVSDDGDGIAAEDTDRIFERFVRLDESRTRNTGGAGLGLPVARAIARTYGGDVRLDGSRHGGATFVIVLPATEDVETMRRQPKRRNDPEARWPAGRRGDAEHARIEPRSG